MGSGRGARIGWRESVSEQYHRAGPTHNGFVEIGVGGNVPPRGRDRQAREEFVGARWPPGS